MNTQYKPPLAIHFVWHPTDNASVNPILDSVRSYFARDVDRPFSRGLNIPLFFYSSECPDCPPSHTPGQQAEKDVVFVFTSVNTLGVASWKNYIDQFPLSGSLRAVPVAIDQEGLGHGNNGSIKGDNFLRSYEWPVKLRVQYAVLYMAHEIYRHGFVEIDTNDKGKSSSIRIFLSHAKAGGTGRQHAEEIKRSIDNTNMSRFFDETDISPGFKFDKEITKHIIESTLVAIGSDLYSSRYWCQREILCAKREDRPIIAVDCLEDYEDRIFPDGANVPCVHVSPASPLSEYDILRILIATILETIRHHHARKSIEYYQKQGWIDEKCVVIARPPEIRKIISLKKKGKAKVCYPEPSLYAEEADWLTYFDVEAFTPLWSNSENSSLEGLRVGISISDTPPEGYANHHLHADHLKRLAQDIARHLLARSATILYGGDLREGGFTQFILDEAIALKNRLNTDNIHVENHLAWPSYVSDKEVIAWRARYRSVLKNVEHEIPVDIKDSVNEKTFIPPSGTRNKYTWSRCLTQMRFKSIESSGARICAGGKLSGYSGKMPGVLEEILIALEKKKPVYLLGAFGGVVGEVCKSISSKSITQHLTEKWQVENNAGYQDLQNMAKDVGKHADYPLLKTKLEAVTLSEMATLAGLSQEDYLRLMQSPFVDECVHLVIKGLKCITNANCCP